MGTIRWLLRYMVIMAIALAAWPLQAKEPAPKDAVLTVANRDIATLRMTALGAPPELRVRRIQERIRQLGESDLSKPITLSHMTI